MRLRLLQFDSTELTCEIRDGQSVRDLRSILISEHGDVHSRSLFFHSQTLLPDDFIFKSSQFQDDDIIVIFNNLAYPEKSFPKVDGAFRFPLTRYDDLWMDLFPMDNSGQGQMTGFEDVNGTQLVLTMEDLNAINRLRQTGLNFMSVLSAYWQANRDEAHALRVLTGNG
jgi:uncharacterized protein YozE (UPF0346 family)